MTYQALSMPCQPSFILVLYRSIIYMASASTFELSLWENTGLCAKDVIKVRALTLTEKKIPTSPKTPFGHYEAHS